jgi:hypothetical protein
VLLNSEDIYRTLSEILLREEDLRFASVMVETLNTILLTSSELFELRMKLKELKTEVSTYKLLLNPFCMTKHRRTVVSRFTRGLHSRIFGCKLNRHKTSTI